MLGWGGDGSYSLRGAKETWSVHRMGMTEQAAEEMSRQAQASVRLGIRAGTAPHPGGDRRAESFGDPEETGIE